MAKKTAPKEPPIVANAVSTQHTKESFEALIERYKEQNPAKYALKKDALQAQLDAIPE